MKANKKDTTLRHYDNLKVGKTTQYYLNKNAIFIGEIRYLLYNFFANTLAVFILTVIFSVFIKSISMQY